jgi:hypothetical protein
MASSEEANTPRIVKIAIWLTFTNTWVLFEEIVVDRRGSSKHMPLYRVGQFCIWDVAAMAVLGWVVWRAFRVQRRSLDRLPIG